jgi:phytoene synthase
MRVSATLMKEPERLSPVPSNGRAAPSLNDVVKVLRGPEVEEDAMRKCIAVHQRTVASQRSLSPLKGRWDASKLEEAYERCGQVTSEYAKTFYLGTQVGGQNRVPVHHKCLSLAHWRVGYRIWQF